MIWRWTAPPEFESTERADVALLEIVREASDDEESGEIPELSRSRVQALIKEGRVRVDGREIRPKDRIRAGQTVEIEFPPPRESEVRPQDIPLEMLYEDEHFLIVNKPPGMTVHPNEHQLEGTLVNALLFRVKDLSGIGGVLRPGIVHRIDKDTSGALLVTKTDPVHRRMAEIFSRHEIERAYWALCYGSPAWRETRVEGTIGRNPADRKKMAADVPGGRHAATRFAKLEEYAAPGAKPFASLVEARLETGRTHQVRVHLTALGHSLLGDPVYGAPTAKQAKWTALPADVRAAVEAMPGQALHARVLGFTHPVTGARVRVEAEPPPAFRSLLETLRGYR